MRDEMLVRMCRLYGHESVYTRGFAAMLETWEECPEAEAFLLLLLECHEADPVVEE